MRIHSFYSELLNGLELAFIEYDADLRALSWNATFLKFFPEHCGHIHIGEHYADNLRRFYGVRLQGADLREIDLMVAEGVQRHLLQSAAFEFAHRGRRLQVNSAALPTGGRIRIWKEVAEYRAAPATSTPAIDTLEKLAEGVCILDADQRIVATNTRFRNLYDVGETEPIVGEQLDSLVQRTWGTGAVIASLRASIRNALRYDDAPFIVELPNDRWRRVVTRHTDGGHAYLCHVDITASHRRERELVRLASMDPLTGLMNRRALAEHLSLQTEDVTFIAIDADHFKTLNDHYGHAVGDACLVRIAGILKEFAETNSGKAARLGGEEFAVVVRRQDSTLSLALAEHIRMAVEMSGEPALTVSLGLANGPASDVQLLADEALYIAKRAGRNRVELRRLAV